MNADHVVSQPVDKFPDLKEMHKDCRAEEALINRIDIKHTGFVTETELKAATKDQHLTAAERKTAATMLLTAEDLRFQRIGYLPSVQMGDAATAVAAAGSDRSWERPAHSVDRLLKKDPDTGNHIKLDDIKTFDKGLDLEAKRRSEKDFISLSDDIMKKYAVKEHGHRLLPSEVWGAVDSLSKKPNLNSEEQRELEILKYTQVQMRSMYPHEAVPADHKSRQYREYMDKLDRIPAHFSEMMQNAADVQKGKFDDQAISDVYFKKHPVITDSSAPMPSAPPAAQRPQETGHSPKMTEAGDPHGAGGPAPSPASGSDMAPATEVPKAAKPVGDGKATRVPPQPHTTPKSWTQMSPI